MTVSIELSDNAVRAAPRRPVQPVEKPTLVGLTREEMARGIYGYGEGITGRVLATGQPILVRWQLPGGVIFDSRSAHYRDLLDKYYLREVHFEAPYATNEIVRDGEVRWEFR